LQPQFWWSGIAGTEHLAKFLQLQQAHRSVHSHCSALMMAQPTSHSSCQGSVKFLGKPVWIVGCFAQSSGGILQCSKTSSRMVLQCKAAAQCSAGTCCCNETERFHHDEMEDNLMGEKSHHKKLGIKCSFFAPTACKQRELCLCALACISTVLMHQQCPTAYFGLRVSGSCLVKL